MKDCGRPSEGPCLEPGVLEEASSEKPELFVGLVGAVGADLDLICKIFTDSLVEYDYTCREIHVSHLLHSIVADSNAPPQLVKKLRAWKRLPRLQFFEEYVNQHMDAGNLFRATIGQGDALALLALSKIRDIRVEANRHTTVDRSRGTVYIIRSLKHPEEIQTLRTIYGSAFLVVGAYAPKHHRIEFLKTRIAATHQELRSDQYLREAESLNLRDQKEPEAFGQNVSDAFPLADAFLDVSDLNGLQTSVDRFFELLFGYPFHTPSRDECGMFHARAAALRSGSLGRQVGAAITTEDGDVVAFGCNDVPKAGGGLYWEGDSKDRRDHILRYDPSDRKKESVLQDILVRHSEDILSRLEQDSVFDRSIPSAARRRITTKLRQIVDSRTIGDRVSGSHVMSLIEFNRSVHAEMAALMDAAKRGVPVKESILYCTTFPCHGCAKHIVAAGIKKVVYIEPYPKSLAPELYLDSIQVDRPESSEVVNFQPFVGISPGLFTTVFTAPQRKLELKDFKGREESVRVGDIIEWSKKTSILRFEGTPQSYIGYEVKGIDELEMRMAKEGLRKEEP